MLAAGCASASGGGVSIRDNSFNPNQMFIKVGDSVTFRNDGGNTHTVTIHDPSFAILIDRQLSPGQSVTVKFPTAGAYHVFCRIHSGTEMEIDAQL
jgi:plastocyanin